MKINFFDKYATRRKDKIKIFKKIRSKAYAVFPGKLADSVGMQIGIM